MSEPRPKSATRAIVVEDFLPHAPDVVWRFLTDSAHIERWLMKNDFKPVVGHRFTLRGRPMGDWNGIVQCEVTVCEPPHRLAYTWIGGSSANPDGGPVLDTVLSITLTATKGGTHLRLVHDGFRSPENDAGFEAMSNGWGTIAKRLDALIHEAA